MKNIKNKKGKGNMKNSGKNKKGKKVVSKKMNKAAESLIMLLMLIAPTVDYIGGKAKEMIFLLMMGASGETGSKLKRPVAFYKTETNVSKKADYLESSYKKMLPDPRFSGISTLLNDAVTHIGDFRLKIQAALGGGAGVIADRDAAELIVDMDRDAILSEIQKAADADLPNAAKIILSCDAYIYTREGVERDALEVDYGEESGTLLLYVRPPAKKVHFAALWEISDDKVNWKMADFSHKAHGEITGLTAGKKYYIRAMTSSAKGKSAWTFTIEIWCH